MRLAMLMSLAMMSFGPATSFAADKACDCTQECHQKCQKGQGQDCKCSHCDCKKTGKCGGDHCEHNHQ